MTDAATEAVPAPMTAQAVARRIAVFGPYSSRNFGDTAIQMAVISNLRARLPQAEIVGICHRARDTLETHGIHAYPLSGDPAEMLDAPVSQAEPATTLRRLRHIYRIAGSIDLLLISGSGQLDDFWGGPWAHPWAMFAWSLMVRLRGGRVAVLGIGLDTLAHPLSRFFAFTALRLAGRRVYRDSGTLDYLQAAGLRNAGHVCPDLVFSFPTRALPVRPASAGTAQRVMVCPISQRAFRKQPGNAYERYIDTLLSVCSELAGAGYAIRLANSQVDMDGQMLRDVATALRGRAGPSANIEIREATTVPEYLALAAEADVVVASRMHGLLLALLAGTPVVGISYTRKVRQVLQDVGCESSCIDLGDVTASSLMALVKKAIDLPLADRQRLEQTKSSMRSELAREYDEIAVLVSTGGRR